MALVGLIAVIAVVLILDWLLSDAGSTGHRGHGHIGTGHGRRGHSGRAYAASNRHRRPGAHPGGKQHATTMRRPVKR
jgi:hypothetical protein